MLELDPRTTALVLVDVQKGTLSFPLAPHSAEQLVETSCRLARATAAAGGLVVLVRVNFGDNLAAAPKGKTDVPLSVPPGGVPADWSEIAPALVAAAPHIVITKRNWSAFYGTELDLQLRRRGITHVVLGGIATNFGVESTARDAWQHNYNVIVAKDAASSLGEDLHRFAVEKTLPRMAQVRTSDDVIEALRR